MSGNSDLIPNRRMKEFATHYDVRRLLSFVDTEYVMEKGGNGAVN